MPLAFHSISHSTIAFGFFNIESDMLLLDRLFFFAPEFCECISAFAKSNSGRGVEVSLDGYSISDPADIGDLMGAIHGIVFTGFIGDTYRMFPFPEKQEDFRQRPEGFKTREIFDTMIKKYAEKTPVPLKTHKTTQDVSIGQYRFTRGVFFELVNYVWRGGYPRWEKGVRPDYVLKMKKDIDKSRNGLFDGMFFEDLNQSVDQI